MPAPSLATIDLVVPASEFRGRAFLPRTLLTTIQIDALEAHLGRSFVDEDDKKRLSLIRRALGQRTITFEVYPGETSPVELHAYVRAPQVSDASIFACVLLSLAVVEQAISVSPHVVLETATVQVIEDEASPASIIAGLESWMRRMWPDLVVPKVTLNQWPDVAIWNHEVPALTSGRLRTRSLRGVEAPPEQLSTQEFVPARLEAPPP